MGIFDILKKSKTDPEVEAAERRAYEKEIEFVRREKKQAAVKAAGERGRARARGTQKPKTSETTEKLISAGRKLWKAGEYGASLNWGGEAAPAQASTRKGKKKYKGRKTQTQYQDPFGMPEFPF